MILPVPPYLSPAYFLAEPPALINKSGISTDPRFGKEVSFGNSSITVEQLILRVQEETGAKLSASKELRYQRLHLRMTKRRAEAVLRLLAELLQAEWVADGDRFVLKRTRRAHQYQETWWQIYDAELNRAVVMAGQWMTDEMGGVDPDAIPLPKDLSPQDREAFKNGRMNARFWYHLPATTKSDLARSLSTTDFYPRLPFVLAPFMEGGMILPFDTLPESCRNAVDYSTSLTQGFFDEGNVESILVEYMGMGFSTSLIRKDNSLLYTGVGYSPRTRVTIPGIFVDHRDIPAQAPKDTKKIPANWRKLIAYQEATVWQNTLPKHKVADRVTPRLPDVLNQMSRKTNTDFLSDDYALPQRPLDDKEKADKWKEPLEQRLNKLAADFDVSWKKSDDVVLVRNNRWYRDDRLEAPAPLVEQLGKMRMSLAASKPPPGLPREYHPCYQQLESAAFVVQNFSPWQIPNGLYFYADASLVPPLEKQNERTFYESNCQPFSDVAKLAYSRNKTVRFYGGLTQDQRVRLMTKGVPVSELSAEQLERLLVAAPHAATAKGTRAGVRMAVDLGSSYVVDDFMFGNRNRGAAVARVQLEPVQLPVP